MAQRCRRCDTQGVLPLLEDRQESMLRKVMADFLMEWESCVTQHLRTVRTARQRVCEFQGMADSQVLLSQARQNVDPPAPSGHQTCVREARKFGVGKS